MTAAPSTVSDRIHAHLDTLTRAERQLAQSILDSYPASGLGTLAALAEQADVSVPTVSRTVQKLGYASYPEFQAALREEMMAMSRAPAARFAARTLPEAHLLAGMAEAVTDNLRRTLEQIDPAAFDAACALVADRSRRVSVVGGRVTHTIAEYLFQHLQIVRPGVSQIRATSNSWPHSLLDVTEGDVFVLFDTRRYETNTMRLAEMARAEGARLILVTDQWRSPLHGLAEITLAARTAVPSPWDSACAPLLLVEAMIAAVYQADPEGGARMARLEETFDKTGLFRKFI
ncbi:MurR/RpiR family transcriptional regulator [Jannaschia sp.]|nr:MurR/RpiR family transcriptional regulator [Jannaschia sp.]